MENKGILIVEDEPDIRELIKYNLVKQGFEADIAGSGTEALEKIRLGQYDLILLDLMLPGIDGIDLCRMLKSDAALSGIPVIILTARSEEIDMLLGLELGADDYVTKPFSPRELVARVKAVLRRCSARAGRQTEEKLIKAGPLVIDTERYLVTREDVPVELSAMEFKLLLYLVRRPGKVLNRDFLLDAIWGHEAYVEPRTVDVHVRRIREKIEDNPSDPKIILTKRGVGYYSADGEQT
ncbi:MAG: response regulator transcription factor [Nitrospiraceae bacterium]|nr:response regulator transcription factor [Nitrospiraceae bacterium]